MGSRVDTAGENQSPNVIISNYTAVPGDVNSSTLPISKTIIYYPLFNRASFLATRLAYLHHTFWEALDAGKEVRAVFYDISKAFDRVWHAGLIHKLEAAGVTEEALEWFRNYLSNRRQRLVLPGASSDWEYIRAGVPQGSILGPLLF